MSSRLFPVMLEENIETARNKTDANAVWLVTDRCLVGAGPQDQIGATVGAASVAATY
jgi:hypothetical protein